MTWRFTGEDLAEECFPSGCCLQHYSNTDSSKIQVTFEEAKGAQSYKTNLLLREILSDWTEDLIEMHNSWWLFHSNLSSTVLNHWIQNLKMPIFFCLNMLEICIHKQSLKPNDLKGIQLYSSHSVVCPMLAEGQTQLQLELYTTKHNVFNLIFWNWSSPQFQDIGDFKLTIGQSCSAWELLTLNAKLKSCNMTHSGL